MNLTLDTIKGNFYKSNSQKSRVISEEWAKENAFCCNCGGGLTKTQNNSRVLDLICNDCSTGFELKCAQGALSKKVPDGSFQSMMSRLNDIDSPTFFFMTYNLSTAYVTNFFAVPVYFIDSSVIEKRKPLTPTARRAGWTGCNILLERVPDVGKIFYVKNSFVFDKENVLTSWGKAKFLKTEKSLEARGWTLAVLRLIQSLKVRDFTLSQLYELEPQLSLLFPRNNFIREKIRQQLQVLRDAGIISFKGRGHYRMADNN